MTIDPPPYLLDPHPSTYEQMAEAFAPGWLATARKRRDEVAAAAGCLGGYQNQSRRTKAAIDQLIIKENQDEPSNE